MLPNARFCAHRSHRSTRKVPLRNVRRYHPLALLSLRLARRTGDVGIGASRLAHQTDDVILPSNYSKTVGGELLSDLDVAPAWHTSLFFYPFVDWTGRAAGCITRLRL